MPAHLLVGDAASHVDLHIVDRRDVVGDALHIDAEHAFALVTRRARWRDAIMPMSFTSVARSLTNSYSSGLICGLRFCISMNFLGSNGPNQAMRTMRNPSAPMLETFSAIYRFMPWIRAVTAISVVVARMIPEQRQKAAQLVLAQRIEGDAGSLPEGGAPSVFRTLDQGFH